jgi:hypothetical protein
MAMMMAYSRSRPTYNEMSNPHNNPAIVSARQMAAERQAAASKGNTFAQLPPKKVPTFAKMKAIRKPAGPRVYSKAEAEEKMAAHSKNADRYNARVKSSRRKSGDMEMQPIRKPKAAKREMGRRAIQPMEIEEAGRNASQRSYWRVRKPSLKQSLLQNTRDPYL